MRVIEVGMFLGFGLIAALLAAGEYYLLSPGLGKDLLLILTVATFIGSLVAAYIGD